MDNEKSDRVRAGNRGCFAASRCRVELNLSIAMDVIDAKGEGNIGLVAKDAVKDFFARNSDKWDERIQNVSILPDAEREAARNAARLLGSIITEKKQRASRENGKKNSGHRKVCCVTCAYYVYKTEECSYPLIQEGNKNTLERESIHPCAGNPCKEWKEADRKVVHSRRCMISQNKARMQKQKAEVAHEV